MMKLGDAARASLLAVGLGAFGAVGSAQALTTFDLVYDAGGAPGVIDAAIVGIGTVSYDEPFAIGTFALSSLTNLSISIEFITGDSFTLADVQTPLDEAFITTFSLGGGLFGMVFEGDGLNSFNSGSLDFGTLAASLSHEPYAAGAPAAGGTGEVNLYALDGNSGAFFADYTGVLRTEAIPLPATALLLGAGLAGIGFAARRRVA